MYEKLDKYCKEKYKNEIEKISSLDNYYGDDVMAKDVLKDKYLAPGENSPYDMWKRLAIGAVNAEAEMNKESCAQQFYDILHDYSFIPGGRINHGLGRNDINVSFSNCYVIPIEDDSLESIYKCITNEALTYKTGGGCGHDLGILRPKNDAIKGTGGVSCGPVGFMNLISESTNTVQQQSRRGANMQTLLVSHPDIFDFVRSKNDIKQYNEILKTTARRCPKQVDDLKKIYEFMDTRRSVGHSNISVKLTDKFLHAVENDGDFDLEWGDKVYETIKAKDLWDEIIKNAWESAEPGIIFWDRMVENNNLEYINPIITVNPCSEICLGKYGNCLLGHMNLSKFCILKDDKFVFDYVKFKDQIAIAMRFLDNVITLNDGRHALKEQNEVALNERRTGLGITGLGDCLIKLGIKYGSKESIVIIESVMKVFRDSAYAASVELAKEKGSFPWFDKERIFESNFTNNLPDDLKEDIVNYGLRNGMLLTCAPVGSGSIIAQISSGIEPIFRVSYTRKVKNPDGDTFTSYVVLHPLIKELFGDIDVVPDYVVDSSEISPKERIMVQATIQKYIDNSISSTVNLPKTATMEDVADVYMNAWKQGCKGVTVYIEGTRQGVLLSSDASNFGMEQSEDSVKIYIKRPFTLEGETHKRKVDVGGIPRNCYITVNFIPGTKIPYELLINEPHGDKDLRDVQFIELIARCSSLMLRHGIPMQFIIEQFEKIQGQYLFSIPAQISSVLRNYLKADEDDPFDICPACGEKTLLIEGGCYRCINEECQHSKCD